ncbi:MAG TPA: ATP-binding protein [Propionibacteriaceae bacterium]
MTASHTTEAIVICGVPASGKTTFARALASGLRWPLLDLDTLTNPLFEYAGGEFLVDVPSAHPTTRASVNDVRYGCLFDTAAENLSLGVSVIMVAPFTSERTFPAAWARLVERLGVPERQVNLTWLDTPPSQVVQRMQHRGAARDLEKAKDAQRFLTPDVTCPPAVDHIRVDGLLAPAAQVDAFLSQLSPRTVLAS